MKKALLFLAYMFQTKKILGLLSIITPAIFLVVIITLKFTNQLSDISSEDTTKLVALSLIGYFVIAFITTFFSFIELWWYKEKDLLPIGYEEDLGVRTLIGAGLMWIAILIIVWPMFFSQTLFLVTLASLIVSYSLAAGAWILGNIAAEEIEFSEKFRRKQSFKVETA